MRFAKLILTGVIGMFIIMTVLSLLIPSTVVVSRTTLINNTNVPAVMEKIRSFNNWKQWYPLFKNDSTKISINTLSNRQSCDINYAGKTAKLIMNSSSDSSIEFSLIAAGQKNIDNAIIATGIPNQTNVQVEWRAINKLNWYPWDKFYGIFIDKLTGSSYENGLRGLKEYLESYNPK